MKPTIFIAAFNQKGGVGKTTINTMLASHVHHHTALSCCVIDADNLQQSIFICRNEEMSKVENPSSLYDVFAVNSAEIYKSIYLKYRRSGEYDFVIVDLPGNLSQEGVIRTLGLMDVVIVPTGFSEIEIQSTNRFIDLFKESIVPARTDMGLAPAKIFFAFNRVNRREKEAKDFLAERDQHYLKTVLPDSVSFRRAFTTVGTYQHYKQKNLVKDFCEEIIQIIQN